MITLGLCIIWLGGLLTGYMIGNSVADFEHLKALRKIKASDLYPRKDDTDANS